MLSLDHLRIKLWLLKNIFCKLIYNNMLNLIYPNILKHFGRHLISGRTESRAFLGWFLENYYRLDETDAQDSICDGPDDKGIDGISVDNNIERIDVFQTTLY